MKKHLTRGALAAAALAAAGAAQAQSSVTLAGLADMYVGSMRMAGDATRRNTAGSGGMTTSWIGVKGVEDLGGGLQVGFNFTSFLRMGSGDSGRFTGDTFWSRDANITLGGGFGTVTLGRWMAPNFLPTILFNPFGDSFAFSPLVLHANVSLYNGTGWTGTSPADTGWANQVAYTTPGFGGLKATLHYQFRDSAASGHNVGADVMYFSGPLGLTAFYERAQLGNPVAATYADGSTRTNWMVGGSYDFQVVKLFLTHGQARNDVSEVKIKATQLGASAPLGPGKLMASVAQSKNSGLDKTRRTIAVGYDYTLSKRTDVYANLMHDRITDYKSGTSYAVGIRHRF
ncbi:porin [Ottowia sp.]|uniref:porin n=1 Tax=Ottowia sp. TaxID=1898956 RepID=UPI0039E5E092